MRPGPEAGSPPLTDHVTGAEPPLLRVAENWWTGLAWLLRELQPLQLVSISAAPGEIENAAFADDDAVTGPAPQPDRSALPATRNAETSFAPRLRMRKCSRARGSTWCPTAWMACSKLQRFPLDEHLSADFDGDADSRLAPSGSSGTIPPEDLIKS